MSKIPADPNFCPIFWLKVERIRLLIRGSCMDCDIRDRLPPLSFCLGVLHIRIVESAAFSHMNVRLIDVVGLVREEQIFCPEDPHDCEGHDQDNPSIVDQFPDPLFRDRELLGKAPAFRCVNHVILPLAMPHKHRPHRQQGSSGWGASE